MRTYRVHRHEVTQPSDQSYRLIPLTQGLNAIVDLADFEWLSQWNWCIHRPPNAKTFYAARRVGRQRVIRMHQEILPNVPNIDHFNGNGLDNRRKNLRPCSQGQNGRNRGKNKNNKSGYKGVSWCKIMKTWKVRIMKDRKEFMLGYFATPVEAAHAYDAKAKELHGSFAHLNFPVT